MRVQEVFPVELEIFQKIVAGLQAFRGVGSNSVAELERKSIAAIVNCVFWSSLMNEEGRQTKVSVGLTSPEFSKPIILFEAPRPLTPESLRKLFPVLRSRASFLGVRTTTDLALEIWGVGRDASPDSVRVEAMKPGQITVKAGLKNIAIFYPGLPPRYLGGRGVSFLVDLFVFLLEQSDEKKELGRRACLLIDLVERMRAHEHGGTILIVPQTVCGWESSISQPVPYSAKTPHGQIDQISSQKIRVWNTQVGSTDADLARKADYVQLEQELDFELDTLAGMTAVDGATILDTKFQLLGFGAKIDVSGGDPTPGEISVTDPSEEIKKFEMPFENIGGTRHQSAARFVARNLFTFAVVASQDGKLTVMFSTLEGTIHAIRAGHLLD
jgi:hypothetical protein